MSLIEAPLECEWRVEVCLDCGPLDVPSDWTDLSDRLISYTDSRGRAGVSDHMQPGTATLEFDNEDGELDPLRVGSLVDFRAGRGLPGCPVRVRIRRRAANGAWQPWRHWFRGYIGEDAWRAERDTEWGDTSSITVVDKVAMLAGLDAPDSVWASWCQGTGPWAWLRSPGGDTLTDTGSLLLDSSGHDREIRVFGPSGTLGVVSDSSLMTGSSDASFSMAGGIGARVESSATFTGLTLMMVWRSSTVSGSTQEIMGVQASSGSGWRLRVAAPTNGTITARVFNSAGSEMGAATVTRPSGRWDDNRPHIIVARFNGSARTLDLWVDGLANTVSGTANVPPSITGRPRVGGGNLTDTGDEFAVFDRTLSFLDAAVAQNIFLGEGWPWPGDSHGQRANRWLDLARVPRDAFDNYGYHTGSGDGPLDGLRKTDSTVGASLAALAESGLGALWANREGRIRLRTRRALDNSAHVTEYRTVHAHLTDQSTPPVAPLPIRRPHPKFSGGRVESIYSVSRFLWRDQVTFSRRNEASIDRFGERVREWESLAQDWQDGMQLAGIDVQDHRYPRVDVESLTIDPQTDPAAAEFIVDDLELERSVWLTWTDRDGLVWLVETAVQGWRTSWTGKRWLVDLLLAPHPGTRPPAVWLALVRRDRPLHLWQLWEAVPNPATVQDLAGAATGNRTSGAAGMTVGPQHLAGMGALLPVVEIPAADLSSVGDGPVTVEMAVGYTPNLTPHAGLAEYVPASGAGFRIAIVSNVLKIWVGGREFTGPVWSDAPGNITFYGHLSVVMSPTGPVSVRIDGVEHPVSVSGSPGVSSWGGPGPVRVGSSSADPAAAAPTFMGGLAVFPGALTNRMRDDHYRAAMQGVLPDPDAPQGYGVFTGGTVHDADGYRYHTFTSSGTLGVVEPGLADVLVVDGGAGGAGGGGGGGMVWEQFEVMIPTSQPVTVGAGGAAIQLSPEIVDAQPGGASTLGSLVVGGSAGQGGSADYEDILTADGRDGTTGGGGSGAGQPVGAGGAGAAGGDGGAGGSNATGGGGGAGGDGGDAGDGGDPYRAGDGGDGVQSTITGDWYGGGGGGAGAAGGAGGTGGGGKGVGATAAEPGAPNTGGGGGGGGFPLAGREGGSGIVVIRTKTPT